MQEILIVEDDEQVRRALARALVGAGYTVTTAANGEEALDGLEHGGPFPRLIILDLLMPIMDGWTFRRQLLAHPQWANVPVIVFSGLGCDESDDALPRVLCLPKPASVQALFDTVARLIGDPIANRPN